MNPEQDNHSSDEQEYHSQPSEDMGQGIHHPVAIGTDAGETKPHEPEDAHLEIDAPTPTTPLVHAGGGDTLPENQPSELAVGGSDELENNEEKIHASGRLQRVIVALAVSPFTSYAAIIWSIYNIIQKEKRDSFFLKQFGRLPIFPNFLFFFQEKSNRLFGKEHQSVVQKKIKQNCGQNLQYKKDSIRGSIRSQINIFGLFLFIIVLALPFVSILVVAWLLLNLIGKDGYKRAWKAAKKSSIFCLKLLSITFMVSFWGLYKLFTGYDLFYITIVNLYNNVLKFNYMSFSNLRTDASIAHSKRQSMYLEWWQKLPWKSIFFYIISFIIIVTIISYTAIIVVYIIGIGVFVLIAAIAFFVFSRIHPIAGIVIGIVLFIAWMIPVWNWVTNTSESINQWRMDLQMLANSWQSFLANFALISATLAIIIGVILPVILLASAFLVIPLLIFVSVFLLYFWFSFQLAILGTPVIIGLICLGAMCFGLWLVRLLRQFFRKKNIDYEEPRKFNLSLVNETEIARQYCNEMPEIVGQLNANDVMTAERSYGIYFDEAETRAWMRKKPTGIATALILCCLVFVLGYLARNIDFRDQVASGSPVLDFIDDRRDATFDISKDALTFISNRIEKGAGCFEEWEFLCLFDLFENVDDGGGRRPVDVTPSAPPPTTTAPPTTTTTEPFRFVEGEGVCIQGEEFFFGGGCIPCETNPSQPACQIDASATRDLECSIAEFEFGGGCVPCSVNPQACAPPGLECAADEFIFGGGCVPCAVDPDSCGDGQTGPATEGVSYTGVLRDGQTRDPPVFASGITGRAKYHLPFGSSGDSPA